MKMGTEQINLAKHLWEQKLFNTEDRIRLSECVLDFLASVLVGAQTEIGKLIIRDHMNKDLQGFAFSLAYLAELSEYSHGHHREAGHIGSSILPVTLSLARLEDYKDADVTGATIAGYETVALVGESLTPDLKRQWGANITGFGGSVGAAAVASRIFGLNVKETSDSLGIAAYLTPFTPQEGYTSGAHGFETGVAVSHGIMAAQLAERLSSAMIDGPSNILDAYYKRLKGMDPPAFFQSLHKTGLAIYDLYFKPYPSCRATHGVIQGIEELLEEGLRVEEVDEIIILTTSGAALLTGRLPSKTKLDYIDRQFSMQYLASAVLNGKKVEDVVFGATGEEDKRFIEFASEKISIAIKDDVGEFGERFGTVIQAWLKDGTVKVSRITHPFGSVGNPMHLDDIQNKFATIASRTIGLNFKSWEKDALELNWHSLGQRVSEDLSTFCMNEIQTNKN